MVTKKNESKVIERMIKNSNKLNVQKDERIVVTISDGKNLKERAVKRGYLKADEMNNFLIMHVLSEIITGIRKAPSKMHKPTYEGAMWDEWIDRGIITKEQKKNLKLANTYIRKFVDDVFTNNLDVKTKDLIVKKSVNWSFRLMDDYTIQKIYRLLEAKKDYNVTKDEFRDLVEAKMEMSCKGCTKNRCECDVHTFFEDNFVPPLSEDFEECNCEYAY